MATTKAKKYVGALDIGSSKVAVLIGEVFADGKVEVVGFGESPSEGMASGMVTDIEKTTRAIQAALDEAQSAAGVRLNSVTTGITGKHIRGVNAQGVVKVHDNEVTAQDIERAIDTAKAVNVPPEYGILHHEIQEFILDSQPGVRNPIGMSGLRLDTRIHIVTGSVAATQNIQKCVNQCHLTIDKMILPALAAGEAVLSEDERQQGVCLIDIGSGVIDIAVYTDGAVRHTAVIPYGGDLVTSDIARSLRTPYSAAENLKTMHGTVLPSSAQKEEMVDVVRIASHQSFCTERATLAAIISARVRELLNQVRAEISRSQLHEHISSIVITGGSSIMQDLPTLAEEIFEIPVRIGVPNETGGVYERLRHPRYATVIGLLKVAAKNGGSVLVERLPEENTERIGVMARLKKWYAELM